MESSEGAVYPGGRAGNYIHPDKYIIPNFCDDCPLVQAMENPQISRVSGLRPVSSGGVRHIGPLAGYVTDVLVLNEANQPEISPVYLGELDIVDPFSVQHESPTSRALRRAHNAVNRCDGPQTEKKIFRKEKTICMSGLTKVIDFNRNGFVLTIDSDELNDSRNVIVTSSVAD